MKQRLLWVSILAAAIAILFLFAACAGPTGPAGEKGSPGEKGATGAAGAPGAPGVSTGTISGVVVDKSGKPVEKATVVTEPATTTATTDKDGKFAIKDLPVGYYNLVASGTGLNAASAKVAILAGKEASTKFTLTAAEPFSLGSVRAVSASAGNKEIFPDKQSAITLTGGYGASNSNLIVTSGLNNVPAGTFVYLEGKDADQAGEKITAWSWTVTGPREKKITVEGANTQLPRFKADDEGRYEVTISVTKEKGGKASSSFEIYAGRYVGVQNCSTCHSGNVMPDKVTEWKETGHGDKFQSTFASYSASRDYCIRCHVVGYDESSKAGGFADAAKQAGWDASKGSVMAWIANSKMTLDQVMKSSMGQFANVQCESCHGPGSTHEGIIKEVETGSLYNPGVCSQCHPQELQWRNSGHSNTGNKEMHMAEGASCVKCHTGQGFVAVTINGEKPVFPNMAIEGMKANLPDAGNMSPIACATCHDPHAFKEPFNKGTAEKPNIASKQLRMVGNVTMPNGVTVDAKDSAACVSCHADKRDLTYKAEYSAGKQTRGAHDDTQADVFYGVTAAVFDFGGPKYATSPHSTVVAEACVQCHMAANPKPPAGAVADNVQVISSHGELALITAGGHSWNMEGTYKDQKIENIGSCTSCHKDLKTFNRPAFADYDGNGKVEGIQDEVAGLLKLVAAQLPKDDKGNVLTYPIKSDKTTELQRQAIWNYSVIANDKSNGVHNAAFSVQVLQRTYKQLTGKDVPGATLK